MAIDLRQKILDDVGARTATLARSKEDDRLATARDDEPVLSLFYDNAKLRIATLANLVTSSVTANTDGGIDIADTVIPRRLWTALTFYVMWEWFKALGELPMAEFYEAEFKKEAETYRFNPDKPTFASRPYRGI